MQRPLALAALIATSFASYGADWTEYRGPRHDGSTPEKIATTWPASGPKVLWKVPSSAGFSSFAVAGGRCFTQELRDSGGAKLETLVARDADTGKELWTAALGSMKTGDGGDDGTQDNRGGDGPRSTPAVQGGRVYTFSAKLVVQAFDAKTGQEVWKRDLAKDHAGRNISWQNAQSPVIEDGRVFVAGGGAGESLMALDVKTGAPIWKTGDEKITHASPVLATIHGVRQVVWFLQSGLVSMDPKPAPSSGVTTSPTKSPRRPRRSSPVTWCTARPVTAWVQAPPRWPRTDPSGLPPKPIASRATSPWPTTGPRRC